MNDQNAENDHSIAETSLIDQLKTDAEVNIIFKLLLRFY